MKSASLWQVSLSKRAVLFGDVLAIGAAFALATLMSLALEEPSLSLKLAIKWFSTQNPSRYWVWLGLALVCLGIFLFRFQHYVNRKKIDKRSISGMKTVELK